MSLRTARMQDMYQCAGTFLMYKCYKYGIHYRVLETDLLAHPELHQPKLCLANVGNLPRLGTTYPYSITNDETVCVFCQHNTGIWKQSMITVKNIEFLIFCCTIKCGFITLHNNFIYPILQYILQQLNKQLLCTVSLMQDFWFLQWWNVTCHMGTDNRGGKWRMEMANQWKWWRFTPGRTLACWLGCS